MPMLMMLFLTLACLPEAWARPLAWFAEPWVAVSCSWAAALLEVTFAAIINLSTTRALARGVRHEKVFRRYLRGRWYHQIGLFVSFGLSLYLFGYGWAIHTLWSHDGVPLPGTELLLLAPFFAALCLSWAFFYDSERHFWEDATESDTPREFFNRPGYVWFQFRQNLALVFLPIVLLVGIKELHRLFPELSRSWEVQAAILTTVVAIGVVVTMPWIVRLFLGLKPLPDGPLRRRLEVVARRLNFRATEILVWNTRGGAANAMVVGVFPFLRYVLLTDRLIQELSPEEVEAVFGHEIGHVKHYHMPLYLVFLLISLTVLGQLLIPYEEQIDEILHLHGRHDLAVLPQVIALALYIFLVFGFLSRRCERQADIYGCRAVSCALLPCPGHGAGLALPDGGRVLCPTGIQTFIQALERVAQLNGISREKPGFFQSWQHSTIARRVSFLQGVLRDPREEPRFQRRVLLVKCGLFAVLAVAIVWLQI